MYLFAWYVIVVRFVRESRKRDWEREREREREKCRVNLTFYFHVHVNIPWLGVHRHKCNIIRGTLTQEWGHFLETTDNICPKGCNVHVHVTSSPALIPSSFPPFVLMMINLHVRPTCIKLW